MKSKWWSLLLGGGVLLGLYAAAEAVSPASGLQTPAPERGGGPVFPRVDAANLEGKKYALPQDFGADTTLCLIAFTQEQQLDINTWLDGTKPLLAGTPGFEVYELPTLSPGTPMFRLWLDGAMRQGIPDKKQREHTITLYLDKEKFRTALNLPDEKRIYALLVDRSGKILWRSEGRFTPEAGRALRETLESRKAKEDQAPVSGE